MRKQLLTIGIAAGAALAGAGAMAVADSAVFAPRAGTFRMLEKFGDAVTLIQQQYVVDVSDEKLLEAAIDGMLNSLDPHSDYLTLQDYGELRETSQGAYGGIGVEITMEDGVLKVITPMDDTPGARAGLQPGDLIVTVDGQALTGMDQNDAVRVLKGAPGTPVKISVVRQGKEPFDLTLTREIIHVKSVKGRMEGEYGVLRISRFNENTTQETAEALQKLRAENKGMKGIVLDLRNNPGGILEQSVGVADVFLDRGEIVTHRAREGKIVERFNAKPGDLTGGLPVVVLTNTGSASAAEIVAGALQDHKRAPVVGLASFGKGSVQTVFPLRQGREGAVKLTTGRYYTPSGRSIQKTGIEPDLEVAQTKEQAEYLAKNGSYFSEAVFRNALNSDEGKTRKGAHEVTEYPPAAYDAKTGDFQLMRAIDVLKAGGDVRAVAKTPRGPQATTAELAKSADAKAAEAAPPSPPAKK
ncbi:MAG TPA: S41 family peptidase [Caulobacteraceae bacterium]|nr:S41 family peptidase [Caulobacteraceae bacterium]